MSALSAWTAAVAQQQAAHEADQRAQDDRLNLEIAATRRAREARRAAKHGSSRTADQPSSSQGLFPPAGASSSTSVSPSTRPRPTSSAVSVASSRAASKVTRVPPPPLALPTSPTVDKENPPPERSASPIKSLLSPTIQAAAQFFEPSAPGQLSDVPRVRRPPTPLSPAKRSFNTTSPSPATELSRRPSATDSVPGIVRRKLSHRSTKSFSYVPTPPSRTSTRSTTPSPPTTLSKANPSRASVQSLRLERPTVLAGPSDPASSSSSRVHSSSSSVARAELAALSNAQTSRHATTLSSPSVSNLAASRHRHTQSVSALPPSASGASTSAYANKPKSIKDRIASLPIADTSPSATFPTAPKYKPAAQSISYLPSGGGFQPSASSSPATRCSSPTSSANRSPSSSLLSTTTVIRPAVVVALTSASPFAFRPQPAQGSPSVKDRIANFASASAGSSASPAMFRPRGHPAVSYLPSGSFRPAGSGGESERARTTSLLSSSSQSSLPKAAPSPAVLHHPYPRARAVSPAPAPAARRSSPPAEPRVPPSKSLAMLAGSGLVSRRVAQAPSEQLRDGLVEEAASRPPLRAAQVVASVERRPASPKKAAVFLQRSDPPNCSASQTPAPSTSHAVTVPAPALEQAHKPIRHLRGPALPGLVSVLPPQCSTSASLRTDSLSPTGLSTSPRALPPLPSSPAKPLPSALSPSALDTPIRLPDLLKSPALTEGGHGLGFRGLSMRRPSREEGDGGLEGESRDATAQPADRTEDAHLPPPTTARPLPPSPSSPRRPVAPVSPNRSAPGPARSPVHVKTPLSPVKPSFKVATYSPSQASPSAVSSVVGGASPVKLTHPTKLRPKRPKAKKARPSYPPALVSSARIPAPPVSTAATGQGRRPSGVPVPVEREEEMVQVVRSPPNSWGRQAARCEPGSTQAALRSPLIPERKPVEHDAQDVKFQQFVSTLLARPPDPITSASSTPLSTDIFSITAAGIHTPLALLSTNAPPVVYDTELLIVVHRAKDAATKLVESKVWAWRGKGWDGDEVGEVKVVELAKRYGTQAIHLRQGEEAPELMRILGQGLVIRQGWRDYFQLDDTALYTVRRSSGFNFIDQVDLSPEALTSRHPLVLSIIGQTFLYVARGSLPSEIDAARSYASSLAPDGFTEFAEDGAPPEAGDTGLFWMCFGEEKERALGPRAHHWRWRPTLEVEDKLRAWRVECSGADSPVTEILAPTAANVFATGVNIVACAFEVYVVVSAASRAHHPNITFACQTASALAARPGPARPFAPPVHTLIMPSKIPADLQTYFRHIDISQLNGGASPDHMNLLTLEQSLADLQTLSWPAARLADDSFLPLGVAPPTA